ncbi:MAG: Fe-S cluster assembly ATPase SufC, partial [Nanoarchaeota archaeon]
LGIGHSFGKRYLNEGFSGGEKKRMEMLQLAMIEPKYALLDETDSGLDIDAMKLVAEELKKMELHRKQGMLVITHYHNFLTYLKPDEVSIIREGRIIKSGGIELAQKIEKEGFGSLIHER